METTTTTTSKRPRRGLLARGADWLLLARPFTLQTTYSARECTQAMAALVSYPQRTHAVGRTTECHRIDVGAYRFRVTSRRYLGRGTYYTSATASGTIVYTDRDRQSHVSGVVRAHPLVLLMLLGMTAGSLGSFALLLVSPIFLPMSLFMLAMTAAHWWDIVTDGITLRRTLRAVLAAAEVAVPRR